MSDKYVVPPNRRLHYEPSHRFDEGFGTVLAKQMLQGLRKVLSLGWQICQM